MVTIDKHPPHSPTFTHLFILTILSLTIKKKITNMSIFSRDTLSKITSKPRDLRKKTTLLTSKIFLLYQHMGSINFELTERAMEKYK